MIMQASNGCFLTQSKEVAFKERRFEKKRISRFNERSLIVEGNT